MTNWIEISVDDLNDYQAGKIVLAARTRALAAGQADPFDVVMPDVISQIRDDVAENPRNALSATANTVPPSLRQVAILLIIEAMQSRLPGITIQDDLKDLIRDAKARLLRVAKGKPIEQPSDPESAVTVQVMSPIAETIGDRPIKTSREAMASI